MEVARGWVVPTQTELCSQPVMEHNVVVHIDYVHLEHEDRPLSPPPSREVRSLGQALYKRVQWRRGQIVVSKVLSSPKLSRPPLPVSSKSNLKDFVIGDEKATSKSATVDKPNSGTTVEKSASNETDAVPEQPKSTTAIVDPPTKLKNHNNSN